MPDLKFNNKKTGPNVLISPLDWGLGHSTRCIPIIRELLKMGCTITIAAEGDSLKLLKSEFEGLRFIHLAPYNIRYSKSGRGLKWALLFQLPRIILIIIKEHIWLRKYIKNNIVDAVISDNRFGLFSKKIKSIYITHQLSIKTGNKLSENLVQAIHYFFINQYDECWVPDSKINGLGGELSSPEKTPKNVKFIGPLSRLDLFDEPNLYDLLFLLSGPEPQRSILENIILKNTCKLKEKIILIRGVSNGIPVNVNSNWTVMDLVSAEELNKLILQSSIVISRSGYTTVMDLVKLKKTALLIPTPGQTEQEYLSQYLMKKKYFYSIDQNTSMNFETALHSLNSFQFSKGYPEWDMYKTILHNFKNSLTDLTSKTE